MVDNLGHGVEHAALAAMFRLPKRAGAANLCAQWLALSLLLPVEQV